MRLSLNASGYGAAAEVMVTPFIVTSEEERLAALERVELLAGFPAGSPEAAEHRALLEAVRIFERDQADIADWSDEPGS